VTLLGEVPLRLFTGLLDLALHDCLRRDENKLNDAPQPLLLDLRKCGP
jgi:hypothetical protein